MPYEIRTLRTDDFEAVFEAFSRAFSDYVVPFHLERPALREMMARRGYVPGLSAAAFDDEGAIGSFILNCLDGDRGYNMGTGTVPEARKGGLSRRILETSADLLRGAGASEYLLEVIESNTPAVRLYESSGFRRTRMFDVWILPAIEGASESIPRIEVPPDDWQSWWDVQPSWQNSSASLSRATDRSVIIGDERACAIVFPSNGDLPQFAVKPDYRRRGAGMELLRSASAIAAKPLRIINIDDRDAAIPAFLEMAGAKKLLRQIEMVRLL